MNAQQAIYFGWIVGIIEGEGSFLLSKRPKTGFYPALITCNTNKVLIDKMQHIFYLFDVPCYVSQITKTSAGRDNWKVDVGGLKRLKRFFEVFKPTVFECKVEEALLLSEYVQLRLSKAHNDPFGYEEYVIYQDLKNIDR